MTLKSISKIIGLTALAAVASAGSISAYAQSDTTTASLTITGGALTLYAGDNTDNNDICTPTDITGAATVDTTPSGGAASSVVCSTAENTATLSALTVQSSRQSTSTTFSDVLFEDLRGLATSTYTVTMTCTSLTDDNGTPGTPGDDIIIALGSNPDSSAVETGVTGAPSGPDAGKLFLYIDPSARETTILRDGAAVAEGIADYSAATAVTVLDDVTPVTLLSTAAAVKPPRADLDNIVSTFRVQASPLAGTYTTTCDQTVG